MRTLNPLRVISRRNDRAFEAEMVEAMTIDMADEFPAMTLLERESAAEAGKLDWYTGEEVRLEHEIADRQEQLRQVRVAISAKKSAVEIIEAGKEPEPVKKARAA